MANELAVRQAEETGLSVTPRNMAELGQLATSVAKSGLYGTKSPDEAFVRMATACELGLSPLAGLRCISVVQGKPILDAALIAALCQRSADCEYWRLVESTSEQCTIETKHRQNGVTRLTYSMADATRAGLTGKDNWRKHPSEMLRARCASSLGRLAYPGVVAGIYTADEIRGGTPADEAVVVESEPSKHSAVAPSQPQFPPAPETTPSEPGVVHAGPHKGKPVSSLSDDELVLLAQQLTAAVADPRRKRHAEANTALLAAIRTEFDRRVKDVEAEDAGDEEPAPRQREPREDDL